MSHSSSPHTSSSLNDMSCYTNEGDDHEFADLAALTPSLFGMAYCNSSMEYGSATDYGSAALMPNHNSPTGSAGHTSPHSDGSDEHRWQNMQSTMPFYPPFAAHQQFYHPTAYPYMTAPSMPIGHTPMVEPISAQQHQQQRQRRTATATATTTTTAKKRKAKKDPNEPAKPVSAYALFFRDTQATIKGQNPNASFGEISKIVASMWDNILPADKDAYKLRTEMAKKEYLKNLAAYRANLVNCGAPMDMRTKAHVEFLNAQNGVAQNTPHGALHGYHLPQPHNNINGVNGRSVLNHDASNIHPASAEASQSMSLRAHAIGSRSLASLIAEAQPTRVLTTTTTLTVPQGGYAQHANWLSETGQQQQGAYKSEWSESQQLSPYKVEGGE